MAVHRLTLTLTLTLTLLAGGTAEAVPFGPPIEGPVTLGHTWRSAELRPTAHSCPAMRVYYGDCWYHPYPAVDFLTPVETPVRAVANGTVVLVGEETDSTPHAWPRRPGRFLLLELDVPQGDCRFVAYKHLSRWRAADGDRVAIGRVVAYSGDTQSPTAHLHLDCFRTVGSFQTYPGQAWWAMRWCNRTGAHVASPATLRMGARLRLGPCA